MVIDRDMIVPVVAPFAEKDSKRTRLADGDSPYSFSWGRGVPVAMSVPVERGGRGLTTHDINGLAYEATRGAYLNEIGYEPTFEPETCKKIGGYAEGAILTYFEDAFSEVTDSQTRIVRKVISLQPNNTMNFVKSDNNPEPYVVGSEVDGKVWWKFLTDIKGGSLMAPDFGGRVLVDTFVAETKTSDGGRFDQFVVEAESAGWMMAAISMDNFEKIFALKASELTGHVNKVLYTWELGEGDNLPVVRNQPLVFDGRRGPTFSFVFPTAAGSRHMFHVRIEDEEMPITIRVYSLPPYGGKIS